MKHSRHQFYCSHLPFIPPKRLLRFAPELSSLTMLEASINTCITVLSTEIPQLDSLEFSTARHIPRHLLARVLAEQSVALRSLLHTYHAAVLDAFEDLDSNNIPF